MIQRWVHINADGPRKFSIGVPTIANMAKTRDIHYQENIAPLTYIPPTAFGKKSEDADNDDLATKTTMVQCV
jgi:hypothetical protein